MASKSKFIIVALLLVLCVAVVKEPSCGCNISQYYGCFSFGDKGGCSGDYNRKVRSGVKESKQLWVGLGNEKRESNGWELRKVPSGPDPLHHHGKSPKKPRSP